MAVELPAPGLGRRRRAEDAEPVVPLAVFLGESGELASMLVQLHHVALGLEYAGAQHAAHQCKCSLALRGSKLVEAQAVAHQERMHIGPRTPCVALDMERDLTPLSRIERRQQIARRPQNGFERYPGLVHGEQSRPHDSVGGYATGFLAPRLPVPPPTSPPCSTPPS